MSEFVKSFARVIETILHICHYCRKHPIRTTSATRVPCRVAVNATWSGHAVKRVATRVLMAVGEWASLAGPGWATPPTLDGGEWTSPA